MKVLFTHTLVASLASLFMFLYMADKLGECQSKVCPKVEPLYVDMNGNFYDYVKEVK